MFELTNEQRKCFGLVAVCDHWERVVAKPSPYDRCKTYLYLNGNTVVKCILCGEKRYCEYELSEQLSEDRKYLLPKTTKGKPVLLSSATILKRKPMGMVLSYDRTIVLHYNANTDCAYYTNAYMQNDICDLNSFVNWVHAWCSETTPADVQDVLSFSQQKRRHVRYQEGDVFRFKISRRLYGYGRILLDYGKMRKKKEPFWDILMGKPLVCSVYHIATERDDVTIDKLKALPSLPSTIIADNALYYGEYIIIGNVPITDDEDYPIMYGDSIRCGKKAVCYQCGKTHRKIENVPALEYNRFQNAGVSFRLNFTFPLLKQCIEEGSNTPYWENYYWAKGDLRNPKHAEILRQVNAQFGFGTVSL